MNEPSKTSLVPPRPNLGPEPLEPPWPATAILLGVGAGLMIVLLLAWRLRRRKPRSPPPPARAVPPEIDSGSPREQMIARSTAVREALSIRFGNGWRAKTTEEIAADTGLANALGADRAEWLIGFLREADRAKFADMSDLLAYSDFDRLAAFVAEAGATSMIKGA